MREIIGLPLALHEGLRGAAAEARIGAMVDRVGLARAHLERYPHQFSGGQRQRIGIARALILRPDFVVCDEPVSALDVSVQAQVLELLRALQERSGVACLFISHDLGVIHQVASRVVVLRDGVVREAGPTRTVFRKPADGYTRMLLDAATRGYGNLA